MSDSAFPKTQSQIKMAEKKSKTQTKEKQFSQNHQTEKIPTRGRIFQGRVVSKFPSRITIEFERTVFIAKYERFLKKKTRIHSRLPQQFADSIEIGDLVRVQECRPLSKLIHSIMIEKVSQEEK